MGIKKHGMDGLVISKAGRDLIYLCGPASAYSGVGVDRGRASADGASHAYFSSVDWGGCDGAWGVGIKRGRCAGKDLLSAIFAIGYRVHIPLPAERADLGVMQRFGVGVPLVLTGGIRDGKDCCVGVASAVLWEDD